MAAYIHLTAVLLGAVIVLCITGLSERKQSTYPVFLRYEVAKVQKLVLSVW
jgi:hypothetical protein